MSGLPGWRSDMVHTIENILVHHMDSQAHFIAEGGQAIGKLTEGDAAFGNVYHHDHGEKFLQNRLGDFHHIDIVFRADGGDAGKDSYHVLTDYSDHSMHKNTSKLDCFGKLFSKQNQKNIDKFIMFLLAEIVNRKEERRLLEEFRRKGAKRTGKKTGFLLS